MPANNPLFVSPDLVLESQRRAGLTAVVVVGMAGGRVTLAHSSGRLDEIRGMLEMALAALPKAARAG